MEEITPGKLKGLKNISTKEGFFIIAALDHRNSLKKLISPIEPGNVSEGTLKTIKIEFTRILAPHASAVLLDPEYGINASEKSTRNSAGLIMSLEESGYLEKNGRRFTKLLTDWNVKKLKKLNADAIKILVYYRPEDDSSEKQMNLIEKVGEMCRKFDITFICEPFVYPFKNEKNFKTNFPSLVIETVREISELDIDVLKVQFPGDVNSQSVSELRKNCEELDSACKVPWVLLSGGARYEEFLKQVEITSKCNASGIMVGRALWQEAFEKKSLDEIINFVRKESLTRLDRLSFIAKNGLPWFERG